jgi:hypothetical protein
LCEQNLCDEIYYLGLAWREYGEGEFPCRQEAEVTRNRRTMILGSYGHQGIHRLAVWCAMMSIIDARSLVIGA